MSAALAPSALSLEIAVYTVRPTAVDSFANTQANMHATLQQLPGFRSSSRLRGVDDPTLFADYILWTSRADAEAAATRLPSLPDAADFLSAIAEMLTFTHVDVDPINASNAPSVPAADASLV